MDRPEEHYIDRYPLYTAHRLKQGDIKASYTTYCFNIISIARYDSPDIKATQVCLFEPIRWLEFKARGDRYIDSLDELTQQIHEDGNNIRKVRFRR